jgi:hypothetical protein
MNDIDTWHQCDTNIDFESNMTPYSSFTQPNIIIFEFIINDGRDGINLQCFDRQKLYDRLKLNNSNDIYINDKQYRFSNILIKVLWLFTHIKCDVRNSKNYPNIYYCTLKEPILQCLRLDIKINFFNSGLDPECITTLTQYLQKDINDKCKLSEKELNTKYNFTATELTYSLILDNSDYKTIKTLLLFIINTLEKYYITIQSIEINGELSSPTNNSTLICKYSTSEDSYIYDIKIQYDKTSNNIKYDVNSLKFEGFILPDKPLDNENEYLFYSDESLKKKTNNDFIIEKPIEESKLNEVDQKKVSQLNIEPKLNIEPQLNIEPKLNIEPQIDKKIDSHIYLDNNNKIETYNDLQIPINQSEISTDSQIDINESKTSNEIERPVESQIAINQSETPNEIERSVESKIDINESKTSNEIERPVESQISITQPKAPNEIERSVESKIDINESGTLNEIKRPMELKTSKINQHYYLDSLERNLNGGTINNDISLLIVPYTTEKLTDNWDFLNEHIYESNNSILVHTKLDNETLNEKVNNTKDIFPTLVSIYKIDDDYYLNYNIKPLSDYLFNYLPVDIIKKINVTENEKVGLFDLFLIKYKYFYYNGDEISDSVKDFNISFDIFISFIEEWKTKINEIIPIINDKIFDIDNKLYELNYNYDTYSYNNYGYKLDNDNDEIKIYPLNINYLKDEELFKKKDYSEYYIENENIQYKLTEDKIINFLHSISDDLINDNVPDEIRKILIN